MNVAILEAQMSLIERARPSDLYCRANRIDWAATEPATGGLFLAPVAMDASRFDFDDEGRLAAIVEVIEADGETVADLAAWLIDEPDRVATYLGAGTILGEAVAANPATFAFGRPLRLFRRPLEWLQAGCDGVVLLNMTRAARWLVNCPAPRLAAENQQHAAQLRGAMLAAADVDRLVVPAKRQPTRLAA